MNWDLFHLAIANAHRNSFASFSQQVVDQLNQLPNYNWVGLYWVVGDHLKLGAWRGPAPTEHVSIPLGQGICGLAATSRETVIVDDVSKDSRYLQCFIHTKSEIVVPIYRDGNTKLEVVGEIDVDGDAIGAFKERDKVELEKAAELLGILYPQGFDPSK